MLKVHDVNLSIFDNNKQMNVRRYLYLCRHELYTYAL